MSQSVDYVVVGAGTAGCVLAARLSENPDLPFACHWGQAHGLNPARLRGYYGEGGARWTAARERLLATSDARRVFSNPLLAEVGLG